MEPLGGQVGRERGDQGDEDLDRRVVEAREQDVDDRADDKPDEDATDRDRHERDDGVAEAERAGGGRGDREAVGDDRRRVVEEALALKHGDQPLRKAQPVSDRCRRDGVGRRYDRAQRDGGRERHARHQPRNDHGHGERGREHQAQRQQRDRPSLPPQLARRGHVASREQDRRQKQEQDDLRLELDPGKAGHEGDDEPAEDHEDRVRHPDPPRDPGQQRDETQKQNDRTDRVHGSASRRYARRRHDWLTVGSRKRRRARD